jgi:hypothetical protein
MPNLTSNILPFPKPGPTTAEKPAATSLSDLPAPVVARMLKSTDADREEHVTMIVRDVIRFARRGESKTSVMPRQLRRWLQELCDTGDPTCLMLREWLEGNRRYLPSGATEAASASATLNQGGSVGEGM